MTNNRFDNKAQLQLFITAVQDHAKVTVKVSTSNFQQEKTLGLGETFTASIPSVCELDILRKSQCSVIVQSSADVAVTALNYKYRTADTSVVYPTTEWGKEYYVITPGSLKGREFSITNGKDNNTVNILLGGTLIYNGRFYIKGSTILLNLKPYESVLIESPFDLTGTTVSSEQPVAVFTGHACSKMLSFYCNHVYEQLLPVDKWGSTFFVPPVTLQTKYDIVYVMASQPTQLNVSGSRQYTVNLGAGTLQQMKISQTSPLYLQADHGIQVLMMFSGTQKGFTFYDNFLMSVLSTDKYCSLYSLRFIKGFDNQALIVIPNMAVPKLRLDGKPLPQNVKWTQFPGTEYLWTQIDSNTGNILSSSGIPFALYSIGFSHRNGYGSAGQCVQPGKAHACKKLPYYS